MPPKKPTTKKNPAAVALGKKGGKASAESMTPEQRTERAKKAASALTSEQRSEAAKRAWATKWAKNS